MTATSFPACLTFALGEEGGYQALATDAGNWWDGELIGTNMGISASLLAAWRRKSITSDDMRALTRGEAAAIYRAEFWVRIGCDRLAAGLDLMAFDYGVNAGAGTARSMLSNVSAHGLVYQVANMGRDRLRMLQALLGVVADGFYGPITEAALQASAAGQGACAIYYAAALQEAHYRSTSGFAEFGGGWLSRLARRQSAAITMSEGTQS